MDKLLAGPLGLIVVLAQAAFFFYLLRGMFVASREDETMFARWSPAAAKRKAERAPHPDAANRGGHGWSRLSPILETFHEPGTGAMSGYVAQGGFAGRRLEDLSRTECLRLYEYCRLSSDDYAMSFLQTYMNYRYGGGSAGYGARTEEPRRERVRAAAPDDGSLTRERAFAALGLSDGASDDDIHKAHRALIKKYHPDRGGSHAQAARINQAKDFLMAKAH